MQTDPRTLALKIFSSWEKSGLTLDACLDRHNSSISQLDIRDRKLFNAIVFGVFRHRETLDWIIGQHAHASLKKIRTDVLYILRCAVFQMFFLDKVPAFAALDTAVNQAKKGSGKKTPGFVNAVLRKISNFNIDIRYPETISNPVEYIRLKYSLPSWIAQNWHKRYGFGQACRLADKQMDIPSITIRVNTLRTCSTDLEEQLKNHSAVIKKTVHTPQGFYLSGLQTPFLQMDAFNQGFFQVQDEAAQMVSILLDPQPDENILDACAGLGTKTCHIAQLMHNQGRLTAMDIEASKLAQLSTETDRLGIHIVESKAGDILKTTIKDFDTFFDRVLIDAPCSGLGVLKRNPDTRWRRKKNDITRMASRQKKILNAAANLVRPGGILVYAVCSCEPEENEDVIRHFLSKRKDFSIDTDYSFDCLEPFRTEEHFVKTYPLADNMDGFFAARLIRTKTNK